MEPAVGQYYIQHVFCSRQQAGVATKYLLYSTNTSQRRRCCIAGLPRSSMFWYSTMPLQARTGGCTCPGSRLMLTSTAALPCVLVAGTTGLRAQESRYVEGHHHLYLGLGLGRQAGKRTRVRPWFVQDDGSAHMETQKQANIPYLQIPHKNRGLNARPYRT
jgi:hypothetical protein